MTSRYFQEGRCFQLVPGCVKDNSSFARRDFYFFPHILFWGGFLLLLFVIFGVFVFVFFYTSMFGFLWKIFLCLPALGIKGDFQIVAGNAEILFIFLFSKFTYGNA